MTTINTPALVSEEKFVSAVEAVSEEAGWLIGTDGIVDPDGNIAILISDDDAPNTSEAGHGLIEWLALTGAVATFVIAVFRVVGPAFITAFQNQIINALP